MAEFRIGRLRYNWAGHWTTGIVYPRDSFVEFNGKTYSCLIPHTASDFLDDINAGYWLLTLTGKGWKNTWTPNTDYDNGSVVSYGNRVYECSIAHKSADSYSSGLEADIGNWTLLLSTPGYIDEWQSSHKYLLDDVVKFGANLWIATSIHTSSTTFDESKWQLWLPGFESADTWNSEDTFQLGDVVKYGGYTYVSKTTNNTNNVPSTDSSNWELFVTGLEIDDAWQPNTVYNVGSLVKRHGRVYSAIADNENQDPSLKISSTTYTSTGSSGITLKVGSTTGLYVGMIVVGTGFTRKQMVSKIVDAHTLYLNEGPDGTVTNGQALSFVGVNGQYWVLVVPGSYWTNGWVPNKSYVVDDLIVWKNITYTCVQDHTSALAESPELDTTNTYWAFYALHARTNTLYAQGQLLTFNNGIRTPVNVGNDQQILRSSNNLPTWVDFQFVENVFYVGLHGTDRADYGRSMDHPWRTINYACSLIEAGLVNSNAKYLLQHNKEWAVAEMIQWMEYQKDNSISPYGPSSAYDSSKAARDAQIIVDAVAYDLGRGGNSQTVAAALAFFKEENNHTYITSNVITELPFFVTALEHIKSLLTSAINNSEVIDSYQVINEVENVVPQLINNQYIAEAGSEAKLTSLLDIVIGALVNGETTNIPKPNQGISATIFVKTGTYKEHLPILVPANTALVGDELRGVVVQPLVAFSDIVTGVSVGKKFIVGSTTGLADRSPVQFTGNIGGVTVGVTYYVIGSSITPTTFDISTTPGGASIDLTPETGSTCQVFGCDALSDMFRLRNSSGIRNMTMTGLLGTLGTPDSYTLQRPTGGSFVCLDPASGPDDTVSWITSRSPYVQNSTTFGSGCTGIKIDGTLHNGGNRSIVANDFTQIIDNGIGAWCYGSNSLTELISVFCYYNYAGYFAEAGGRIRAANGNSSYGTFGAVAEGYDGSEVPGTGIVYNRSTQVQASIQQSFGSQSKIVKFFYNNAGSNYNTPTTNFLQYSNNFLAGVWTGDGNVSIQKNTISPTGYPEAWTLGGIDSISGQDYLSQSTPINNPGNTYTNVSGTNITGSGINATFDIQITSTTYVVTVNNPGTNYVTTNQIRIPGSQLGGINGSNDLTITVTGLFNGSSIYSVSSSGLVPPGSDLPYVFSIYAKKGTASQFAIDAVFSGSSTRTSRIIFDFTSATITCSTPDGGFIPVEYNATLTASNNGWYRIWFKTNDVTAANSTLSFKLYPRGYSGTANTYTYFYGAQVERSTTVGFYLESTNTKYTSYANYEVVGNGSGVVTVGDETRSGAVFQTRIIDPGAGAGGANYLTASNNAQSGDTTSIMIAASDINLPASYVGMRLFLTAGTGAGQYGFISYYDATSKIAQIVKESFDVLNVVSTSSSTNRVTISSGDMNTVYQNQPVQFIPTYYTLTATAASLAQVLVTAATGGTTNTLTVASTSAMSLNMPISFTGVTFSAITPSYTYYIKEIVDETTIKISTVPYGPEWQLNTAIGTMTASFPSYDNYLLGPTTNMVVNYPIEFTGNTIGGLTAGQTYYINDVINSSSFSVSNSLVTISATATIASSNPTRPNQVTVDSTASLTTLNPIVFTNTVFGNIVDSTKYYIRQIVDNQHIVLTTGLSTLTVTHTDQASSLLTVNSTSSLVANAPIKFIGNTFGGINNETIYYVQVINDLTTFTISTSPNGAAFPVSDASGLVTAITCADVMTQITGSGTMTGTTTSSKLNLSFSPSGAMNGTFATPLFGGVVAGTTYYVNTIVGTELSVSAVQGSGVPITLTTKTGSMNIAAAGWDNVNYGTQTVPSLDSSTIYYIEPRLSYSEPPFTQVHKNPTALSGGATWVSITTGNNEFIAIPSTGTIGAKYSGTTWSSVTFPVSASWTDISFGAGYWVIISSGGSGNSTVLYSFTDGATWTVKSLPSATTWSNLVYGNGKFVAIATGTATSAYSSNYGDSWTSGSGLPNATWTGLTYGKGIFVAVASGGSTAAYSTDGISWTSASLTASTTWSDVAYGNNIFVAVSNSTSTTSYSSDGINWYASNLSLAADKVIYGQGVFLALSSSSATAYVSPDGINWKQKTAFNDGYTTGTFGFNNVNEQYVGQFITLAGSSVGSIISTGTKTLGRPIVVSGIVASVSEWEPGSGYINEPTLTITDPNATSLAITTQRIGNGALASPSFVNRGFGYNTSSTSVTLTGNGYADQFQTGLTVILNNLSRLPQPGDSLTISGVPQEYKVTSATGVFGTQVPFLEANVQISPAITLALSPENNTAISLRSKYSQVRLTGHDFLDIGQQTRLISGYPNIDVNKDTPQNQTIEENFGRVFYVSTDQDGNFKVGNLFGVQQATGIVTISASQFGLTGLNSLRLGGIAVGGNSVTITQFSTDVAFVGNSDAILPTQKAIKTYLGNRLTQGGANTATGLLIAGSVQIGGPNKIGSTIPAGNVGSVVKMTSKVNIAGALAGIDGNMAAMEMFLGAGNHKSRTF